MIVPFFNCGHIPMQDSAENALTEWASTCERKLLQLGCGTVLPRERHRAWAHDVLPTRRIMHFVSKRQRRIVRSIIVSQDAGATHDPA